MNLNKQQEVFGSLLRLAAIDLALCFMVFPKLSPWFLHGIGVWLFAGGVVVETTWLWSLGCSGKGGKRVCLTEIFYWNVHGDSVSSPSSI